MGKTKTKRVAGRSAFSDMEVEEYEHELDGDFLSRYTSGRNTLNEKSAFKVGEETEEEESLYSFYSGNE